MRQISLLFLVCVVALVALAGAGRVSLARGARPSRPLETSGRETVSGTTVAEALQTFGSINIEKEPRRVGYSRDLFTHWLDLDGDGCNTRQQVLRDQSLTPAQVDQPCFVVAGDWYSAYDGRTLDSPADIEIDHVVALAEAWDSGANSWNEAKRSEFANDTSNLLAVSAATNQAKEDRDPAQWSPPRRDAACLVDIVVVRVKAKWKLSIDPSEAAAIRSTLSDCESRLKR